MYASYTLSLSRSSFLHAIGCGLACGRSSESLAAHTHEENLVRVTVSQSLESSRARGLILVVFFPFRQLRRSLSIRLYTRYDMYMDAVHVRTFFGDSINFAVCV